MVIEPGTICEFKKMKWGGIVKLTHKVAVLGSDEYGLWVGNPAGAEFHLADGGMWVADADSVACINPDQKWIPWFIARDGERLYLDVLHTGSWDGTTYGFIDLDLDVAGNRGEPLEIVDIDELETHTRLYAYPPEVVEEAWTTATEARRRAESGEEPYATVGWAWLARFQR